jgi:hypothetical protein
MPDNFPWFIHIFTVPLTLGVGFFLGWIFRGAAERKHPRKPNSMSPIS